MFTAWESHGVLKSWFPVNLVFWSFRSWNLCCLESLFPAIVISSKTFILESWFPGVPCFPRDVVSSRACFLEPWISIMFKKVSKCLLINDYQGTLISPPCIFMKIWSLGFWTYWLFTISKHIYLYIYIFPINPLTGIQIICLCTYSGLITLLKPNDSVQVSTYM